jgi:hypothetical protein
MQQNQLVRKLQVFRTAKRCGKTVPTDNQQQPYPDNASQTQQPSYPAQQPMYQGEQGQPYLPSPQIRPSYDQYAPVVDEPQAGGGERGLGTHIVGAAGVR